MEGVDHVHVVQIGGGRLVGQVHRVLQGQVPDGEGLELGVARHHAPLVLVVHLGQGGGQLAAAGARGGEHHQGLGGLDVGVGAVALVGADVVHRHGVAGDGPVDVVLHAPAGELFGKGVGGGLAGVLGDDHAVHRDVHGGDVVDEAQHLHVVADAQVRAHLGLFDVAGGDTEDDFGLVPQFVQQANFAVHVKAGQHPGGVVVVEELAAELQIQLALELVDPGQDVLGLFLNVKLVVKSDPHTRFPPRIFQK